MCGLNGLGPSFSFYGLSIPALSYDLDDIITLLMLSSSYVLLMSSQ